MNKKAFEKAKATFDYNPREKAIAHLLPIRDEFVQYFDREKIRSMKFEDYAIGHGTKDWHIFCYGIERTFNDLGCILGATSRKFGIFYSPGDGEYKWAAKYGETKTKAFNKIKKSILALLDAGENGDIDAIADNMLSSMVKGKILSLYYPEKYLNIFSDDHLNALLIGLGLNSEDLMDKKPVYKRQRLVEFKNADPDMKSWPMDKFSDFLYNGYPKMGDSNGGEEDDDEYSTGTVSYHVDEKTVEMELKHKEMQKAIKEILKSEGYVNVYLENEYVDVKAFTKYGSKHFFEIKTYDAKQSIREALGQIMEYSFYTGTQKAKELYIVGPEPPTDEDRNYLEYIREKFNLPIWFRYYSFEENKLYPKI